MTLAQALRCYTHEGAYAAFHDGKTGVIAPSHLADFAVMDQDLFAIDSHLLKRTTVLRTIVGGVQRFG